MGISPGHTPNSLAHRPVSRTLCAISFLCIMAYALPAQSPAPVHVDENAAYRALLRLERYINTRSAGLRAGWVFGPNLDDCYFYRTRYTDTSELLRGEGNTPQKQFAVEHGVPALDTIPEGERRALYIANYHARRSAMDDARQFLCVKHFPGGSRFLENTEHIGKPVVYPEGFAEWEPRLWPFRTILAAPEPVPSMMTSHACYPGLEQELRKRHTDIETWITPEMDCPGTFSPFILRGLLRGELGYEGPVVTDWVDMGAITRFLLDYRKRMPARYAALSSEALIIVLALEAGCHFVTGIQNRLLRIERPVRLEPLLAELAAYRNRESRWEATVNARANEALSWFALPPFSPDTASVNAAMNMPFRDKMRLVIGEPVEDPQAQWVNKLATKGFQDLWNRQGLIHAQLRAYYIAEKYGIAVTDLPYRSDDERVVTIDKNIDWIDALMDDNAYATQYRAVDWDSGQSSSAWQSALERFMNERGYSGQ